MVTASKISLNEHVDVDAADVGAGHDDPPKRVPCGSAFIADAQRCETHTLPQQMVVYVIVEQTDLDVWGSCARALHCEQS